ncbi:MAG TPA: hypothetical protein VFZ65_21145 [Planctomycetota bacterium]|nr:hypothetical protein [Planctomycetota bacterium]
MYTRTLAVLALALLGSRIPAQRLIAYEPLAGLATELQPPTGSLPMPNPPSVTYPVLPALPPPLPGLPSPGDVTFDNGFGLLYYTNGSTIAAMASPTFAPLMAPPASVPIPASVLAMIGGPVTGMAIDALTGLVYLTSVPGIVVGVGPVPGLPVLVPPFPAGGPVGIAGLDYDGLTGTLWAVDVAGTAYNFAVGGAPVGPPVVPIVPPPGPVGGIAIDKLGKLNPAGLRPLYVGGGPLIVDIRDPAAIPFPAGPPVGGLTFMDHPATVPLLPGCESCPGATTGPTAFTTGVMSIANPGFAVGMGGLTPGVSFGIFAFDSVSSPFVSINGPAACPLGLAPGPGLILVIGGPANAAGTILMPIPFSVGTPVGLFLHNQNLTFCPAQPSGLAFSRFQTITVGAL